MSSEAIAKIESYAVMKSNADELREALVANVGAGTLSPLDLERIRVPAAGGLAWSVPQADGAAVNAATFEAVIVNWSDPRAYWAQEFAESGGGAPPDCHSDDGVRGVGNPGGACEVCQFAQFGSARGGQGAGQACRSVRMLFILFPWSHLPCVVAVPSGSIKVTRAYLVKLAGRNVPCYGIVTTFGLETANSKPGPGGKGGGIKYSRVTFTGGMPLPAEARARLKAYADTIRPLVARASRVERADVEADA